MTGPETDEASGEPAAVWARLLPVGSLEPDPDQPRRTMDDSSLRELADSIRAHGVLQPIVVRAKPGQPGRFSIVAGERRWRAAVLAECGEVPCMVMAGASLRDARLAQLVENLQREDLSPMDEARAIVACLEAEGITKEEMARRIGKSPAYISRFISISKIVSSDYEELSTLKATAAILYEFSRLPADRSIRARAIERIRNGATVREIERLREKTAPRRPPQGGRRGAESQRRPGRPAAWQAPVARLQTGIDELDQLDPEWVRSLPDNQQRALLAECLRLVRWSARAWDSAGIREAARLIEGALDGFAKQKPD